MLSRAAFSASARCAALSIDAVGNSGVGRLLRRIEHAQAEACVEQSAHGPVDGRLVEQSLLHGFQQGVEDAAALQIAAVVDGQRRGFGRRVHDLVVGVDIGDRPAVGDDVAGEAPLLAQDLLEQRRAGAAGLAVGAVVRAHDGFDIGLP